MLRFIFELVAFYFLYRFVVGFVVPMFFTVRQVRRTMKSTMPPSDSSFQPKKESHSSAKSSSGSVGEYIDFEEIK